MSVVELRAHLGDEAGLADARLAGDEHEATGAVAGGGDPPGEHFAFALAADVGRAGPEVGRAGRRLPRNVERGHRLGEALELQLADRRHLVAAAAARQHPHDLGDQHLPAVGRGAQSRRLDDRRTEAVAVLERDVAGRDADPDRERQALAAGEQVDRALHGDPGGDGLGRAGEHHEHAVAEPLHDGAAVRLRRLDQRAVVGPAQRLGPVLTDLTPERGRADEIGHEDRRGLRAHCPSVPPPGRRTRRRYPSPGARNA